MSIEVSEARGEYMRALVQRVTRACVQVNKEEVGSIGRGFLIFLGVGHTDTQAEADKLWSKISKLRIFDDENGKTNLALRDVGGAVLVVSQFTLYANCKKGNRPSFVEAGAPEVGNELYEYFASLVKRDFGDVQTGVFGADMAVELVNDGPFTIWLDTDML